MSYNRDDFGNYDPGNSSSTSYDPSYWPSSVQTAIFAGVSMILIAVLNSWVVVKASKDENPSSFVRLVKILGILNLCSIPMWFLGVFLINISPEYQSTLFPFLYCYFLGPVDTFFILLVTVTVILAGVDCVLASKKSTFDTTRLFFMVVPLLAIVCLVYAFRNRPEAVSTKLFSGDIRQRYVLDFSGFTFDLTHVMDTFVFPLVTIVSLAVLIVWVCCIMRGKNAYSGNGSSGYWEEKVFIVMGLILMVPAIYRIVDTLHLLIYFLPYDVEVYFYLVWALAQNLVAAPYLFWD